MQRRSLLAAPAAATLAATAAAGLSALAPGAARAQGRIVTEEFIVPLPGGAEAFARSKRPEGTAASPGRTVVFVQDGRWPGHTTFDLPLVGQSWMDYVAARGFDAWCLDLPGWGRASRPAAMGQPPAANPPLMRGEEALGALAAALAFVRERRGVARTGLIGWGWGAALAARLAAENPNLVERLVLHGPHWLAEGAAPVAGAYRTTTQAEAREAWLGAAPEAARAALIPPGWFEHFAGVTWATDPDGLRRNPAVLRIPNGPLADAAEFWLAGRPFFDPARITAPSLVVTGEWDRDAPPAMAVGLFQRLSASPGKRCVLLGEGTHGMLLERGRGLLYQAVQVFLEEASA